MASKKLLQIELNEFDPAFLKDQAEKLNLENISKFLSFKHTHTLTNDEVEHQGLDPWVQWVNVHTGMPSDMHGIKRLGDTVNQQTPQIWETLAKSGKRWAVWGVMNAPMGDKVGATVFMPDPWSFDERAYPESLNFLLSLPRYMARNYLETDKVEFAKRFMDFVRYYAPPSHWPTLMKFSTEVVKSTFSVGMTLHSLTTLLDYLGTLEFLRYRRRNPVDFSVIFLNHIAHLQHQFWNKNGELHPEMKFGLEINNLIMGLLLDSREEDEAVIILNGLKQENVQGQGVCVYRQINPERTFKTLAATDKVSIEQCMTNDAHLKFDSENEALKAKNKLKNIRVGSKPLFFVEEISKKHIFVQISLEDKIEPNEQILVGNQEYSFYDLFDLVCERTGAHVPTGDVFASGIDIPDSIYNHEIYQGALDYFNVSA